MHIKFSEAVLRQLRVPDGQRDYQWFDSTLPGFGIRKFASGRGAFIVKYRVGTKQRKLSIGKYIPGVLTEMRRHASDILTKARSGEDVRAAKSTSKYQRDALIGELIIPYLDARRRELSQNWYIQLESHLRVAWGPYHERPLRSLERAELVLSLDKIASKRGLTTADHIRKALSGLFVWGIDRGYADANPLTRLKRYAVGKGRERILCPRELVALWLATEDDDFGRIVRLLILTLQRKTEIGDIEIGEVDLDIERAIKFAGTRTKNKLPHQVPLSNPAIEILQSTPRNAGRLHIFGEMNRGFQGWSHAKARIDALVRRILDPELMSAHERATGSLHSVSRLDRGESARRQFRADKNAKLMGYEDEADLLGKIMPHWTLHDLRRTGGTLMNEYDLADPHVVEAILNHISGKSKAGVAGVYNRAKYEAQKRRALDRWGDFVMKAVSSHGRGGFAAVDQFTTAERKRILNGS